MITFDYASALQEADRLREAGFDARIEEQDLFGMRTVFFVYKERREDVIPT